MKWCSTTRTEIQLISTTPNSKLWCNPSNENINSASDFWWLNCRKLAGTSPGRQVMFGINNKQKKVSTEAEQRENWAEIQRRVVGWSRHQCDSPMRPFALMIKRHINTSDSASRGSREGGSHSARASLSASAQLKHARASTCCLYI